MNTKKDVSIHDSIQYLPFSSDSIDHNIKKDHYSTSLDPRGYIPVYEYTVQNTPIMWDRETGYVHFTGIWKALGNSKSDIVKMVDSNPNLSTKKIRGGFLRIQGTWIPFEYAHILCKRTAWNIKHDLVPLFGPTFPDEALSPDHEDFGCLLLHPSHIQPTPPRTVRQKKVIQKKKRKDRRKKTDSMAVKHLLNTNHVTSEEQSTPSPRFRVVQTFPPEHWPSMLLPPIYNNITAPVAQDIIDTISATILLQRLSQDDGKRPFRPLESTNIPSKVIVGHQEFSICWE